MVSYIARRLAYSILLIFVIATITFFLMNFVPGGPFLSEKNPPPAVLKAMNEKYDLDKPIIFQYKNYIIKLVQGDLGVSVKKKGRSVTSIIGEKFPVSAQLGGIAILTSLSLGITMGALAAFNKGKITDYSLMFVSTLGVAIPNFVIATVLIILFGVRLKIFPTFGLTSPIHYVLPVITLSLYPMSYISRLMRSSLLDVLSQDYIRTARAKGVSQFVILFKHAMRNAILPIITYLGPLLAYTLAGSFVVEKIFTIPGMGGEFINSIGARDYPLIMGTTIFFASLLVVTNLFVDIAYKVVDPRIELK